MSVKNKRPSFQFYPKDWQSDPSLAACSLSSRGMWMELVCIMHDSDRYGYLPSQLVDINDIQGSLSFESEGKQALNTHDRLLHMLDASPDFCYRLSRMVRSTPDEVRNCLIELAQMKVFDFSDSGIMHSKRMVRDEEIRRKRAAGGNAGGNPLLLAIKSGDVKLVKTKKTTPKPMTQPADNPKAIYNPDKSTSVIIPEWLPIDLWLEFVKQRDEVHDNKLTNLMALRAIQSLVALKEQGQNPVAVIRQTLNMRWQGFFPVKRTLNGIASGNGRHKVDQHAQNAGGIDKHGNIIA